MEKNTKNQIIKFRGKQICDGIWVYGNLIIYSETDYEIKWFCDIDKKWYKSKVIPETVGRFTGKTDKNKKEIYEDDIIRAYSKGMAFDMVLKWDNYLITFMVYYVNGGRSPLSWFTKLPIYELKVIGNIYDNKDLLKKEL